jgi:hypothetical protein
MDLTKSYCRSWNHAYFTRRASHLLVYVDDSCFLFFGQDSAKIGPLAKEIEDQGFDVTIEDNAYTFLGVEVTFNKEDGTVVTLTQTAGLIDKIIRVLGLVARRQM